jgi:hypothetical protein
MMSVASATEVPRVELCYSALVVGHLTGVFNSDGTWYGALEPSTAVARPPDLVADRVNAYVAFSRDWTDRTHGNPDDPPDASEFDAFSDITDSNQWFLRNSQGAILPIRALVFWQGNDVSW